MSCYKYNWHKRNTLFIMHNIMFWIVLQNLLYSKLAQNINDFSSSDTLQLLCCFDSYFELAGVSKVLTEQSHPILNSWKIYYIPTMSIVIAVRLSYKHRRSWTRVHTHPYERTHVHPTIWAPPKNQVGPINLEIDEVTIGASLSTDTSPTTERITLLNPGINSENTSIYVYS